jgi:hypothetical protein
MGHQKPGPPRRRRWYAVALSVVVAGLFALPGADAQSSAGASAHCQPFNTLPGVTAERLHDVSGATACRVAMSFYRWWQKDDHVQKLYSCRSTGHPVLHIHTFDGWRLTTANAVLTMSRGAASFVVIGQDFPIDCF